MYVHGGNLLQKERGDRKYADKESRAGLAAAPESIVVFAVGVLVLIVVLYLVDLFLGWLAANMGIGAPIVEAIRFIITVVALIALILIAGGALIGGGGNLGRFRLGQIDRPAIQRAIADLPRMLKAS